MSNKVNEIDVEKIMQEIREEIKRKGYKESDLSFNDIPLSNIDNSLQNNSYNGRILEHNIAEANHLYNVSWHYQLCGNGLGIFLKKVIRKLVRFMVIPIVEKQNLFNIVVTRSFNEILHYIHENEMLKQRIEEMENQQDECIFRIRALENEIKKLKN